MRKMGGNENGCHAAPRSIQNLRPVRPKDRNIFLTRSPVVGPFNRSFRSPVEERRVGPISRPALFGSAALAAPSYFCSKLVNEGEMPMSDELPAAEATLPAAVPAAAPPRPPEKLDEAAAAEVAPVDTAPAETAPAAAEAVAAEVAPADVAPTAAATEAVPADATRVDTPASNALECPVVNPLAGATQNMSNENKTPDSKQGIDLEKLPAWKTFPVPTQREAMVRGNKALDETFNLLMKNRHHRI